MYYKRKIFKELLDNLKNNNKIIILTGARQVGKTSLMKELQKNIKLEGNTVFIDLDLVSNLDKVENLESFLDFLRLNGYDEKMEKFYIFIDEFQRAKNITALFKNIYDHYGNIKIIASGSSSLSIKNNIKESLAGRKFVFEIFPLDFEEFLWFKQDEKTIKIFNNLSKLKSKEIELPDKLKKYLDEFLVFGAYPEIALTDDFEIKKKLLASIFDLYLEKDIMIFSDIENISAFKKIIEILSVNNGQEINYNRLASEVGIHNKTIRSYLALIEDTYIIKIIRPFYSNKNKEVIKTPKFYFMDIGVRNYFLNNYTKIEKRVDKGQIWETYILQELVKNKFSKIKFWRTKAGAEVDFVLEEDEIIPIEVKFKTKGNKKHFNNLLSFLRKYELKKAFLFSNNFNDKIFVDDLSVSFNIGINFVKLLKK